MPVLILSLAWAALIAWLIARAVTQYGAYRQLPVPDAPLAEAPSVAVIVPARDEAANIEPCLRGLLRQDFPADSLRIIVVDDGSTDATPRIVSEIAATDSRVQPRTVQRLPSGWTGKCFACWSGAGAAESAEWLCFLDADVRVEPPLLRSAVTAARSRGIDMLSLEPFQILGSFWERLIFPAGFLILAFSQDLRQVNDPTMPQAFANGQFILIRREIYFAVGGHEAVRTEIAEDSALARRVKGAGHRLAILGAESMLRARMYTGLAALWEGISKNLLEMVGGAGRALTFAAAGVAMAVAAIGLPLWAWWVLLHSPVTGLTVCAVAAATAGSAALFGVHIGAAVHFRIPAWYGVLFPLGCFAGAALAIDSVRKRSRGRVGWKGRVYDGAPAADSPDLARSPARQAQ